MRSSPGKPQPDPSSDHSITHMARIDLSCGSFDALRAIHFSRPFPPHFHDTFAIGVIESGATRLRTRRGTSIASAGTILAFSPGEIHSAEPLTTEGFTYRMVYPTAEFMRELGIDTSPLDSGAPLFSLPVIDDPALGHDLQNAHVPLMDGVATAAAEERMLTGIRNLVARYAADAPTHATCRAADLAVVERAQDYLHERFAQQVRLSTLADICGLSAFHLIRVFRRVLGVPPYAYLVQLRVNRAQAMLCSGSSVADVAYSCGFSDQSHLTRTFRKAVGVPPGQYVRAVRQSAA
jgi:AraC-like DNA-binding protein